MKIIKKQKTVQNLITNKEINKNINILKKNIIVNPKLVQKLNNNTKANNLNNNNKNLEDISLFEEVKVTCEYCGATFWREEKTIVARMVISTFVHNCLCITMS